MPASITMETIHDDIQRLGIQFIELQYIDPVGGVHSNIINATKLSKDADGNYIVVPNDIEATLDGSSIPGFQNIDKTGLQIVPGPRPRIYVDPTHPTRLVIMGNTQEPNGPLYPKDPRAQAILAEEWLPKQTELGLQAMLVGPEFEFFVFPAGVDPLALNADNAAYHCSAADNPNQEFMEEYMLALQTAGVDSRFFHSEVATYQEEIGVNCETLLRAADNVIIQREILKKLATKYGVTVSWEPKLLDAYRDTIKQSGKLAPINGSGLHTNLSFITEAGGNAFVKYDLEGRPLTNELSDLALLCIAGILKHANSLQAFFNPSTISGARLGMGESPKFIVAGHDNRSAMIRIVTIPVGQEFKTRIEVRAPDSMTCPYSWFAAAQMAMVDAMLHGISIPRESWSASQLEPQIIDANFYKMPEEVRVELSIPELHTGESILRDSINSLERDHAYLLAVDGPFGENFAFVLESYCQTIAQEDEARELRRDVRNQAWIQTHSVACSSAEIASKPRARHGLFKPQTGSVDPAVRFDCAPGLKLANGDYS